MLLFTTSVTLKYTFELLLRMVIVHFKNEVVIVYVINVFYFSIRLSSQLDWVLHSTSKWPISVFQKHFYVEKNHSINTL